MNELMLLAENFKASVLAGVNLGWQGIGGIILFLTGIGLIYFGIKALKGYRFFPDQEQNIPEEDHYEPMQAKALQKVKTTMPSFSGGEDQVFVEWKIGYTVNGEKYTQIVTDNGYNKGDMIDIKYNPENPQEAYLRDNVGIIKGGSHRGRKGSRAERGKDTVRLCGDSYRRAAGDFRRCYAYRQALRRKYAN